MSHAFFSLLFFQPKITWIPVRWRSVANTHSCDGKYEDLFKDAVRDRLNICCSHLMWSIMLSFFFFFNHPDVIFLLLPDQQVHDLVGHGETSIEDRRIVAQVIFLFPQLGCISNASQFLLKAIYGIFWIFWSFYSAWSFWPALFRSILALNLRSRDLIGHRTFHLLR